MITDLKVNHAEVDRFNKIGEDLFKEGTITEKVHYDYDDVIVPWSRICQHKDIIQNLYVKEHRSDFDGVFLLCSGDVQSFCSNYEEDQDYEKNRFLPYGVSDNVSQIIDYIEKEYAEVNLEDTILAVMPVFKKSQPERDGWRWHKWGTYIGKYPVSHEYLYDEEGINMVLTWEVIRLKKR